MIEFAAMLFAHFENLGRRFTASTGARLPQNLGEQNQQVNRWDLLDSRPAARSNACSLQVVVGKLAGQPLRVNDFFGQRDPRHPAALTDAQCILHTISGQWP